MVREKIDLAGAFASWLCIVHCVALPLAASVLPLFGLNFLLDETAEVFIIGFSVLIAAVSLLPSYLREHANLLPIGLFIFGLVVIVGSHELFEETFWLKTTCLIIGAAFLTAAHLFNRRLCKKCVHCEKHSVCELT